MIVGPSNPSKRLFREIFRLEGGSFLGNADPADPRGMDYGHLSTKTTFVMMEVSANMDLRAHLRRQSLRGKDKSLTGAFHARLISAVLPSSFWAPIVQMDAFVLQEALYTRFCFLSGDPGSMNLPYFWEVRFEPLRRTRPLLASPCNWIEYLVFVKTEAARGFKQLSCNSCPRWSEEVIHGRKNSVDADVDTSAMRMTHAPSCEPNLSVQNAP